MVKKKTQTNMEGKGARMTRGGLDGGGRRVGWVRRSR